MTKLDTSALQKAVAENHYFITLHAKSGMGKRKISDSDIKYVVETGDVIEEHPNAKPFPRALFMEQVRGEPLYVACAHDGQDAYITVYWYDPSKWIDPWTRRKG